MHEASIARSILDIAVEECLKNSYKAIQKIKVEIGLMNAVNRESLLFAFDVMKLNTIAKEAELEIVEKPVGGYCMDCKRRFTAEGIIFECPLCGGEGFRIDQGRELNIIEIEVVDEAEGYEEYP